MSFHSTRYNPQLKRLPQLAFLLLPLFPLSLKANELENATLGASDLWVSYIGRFHPLFVHLPIGIILAALALEILAALRPKVNLSSVRSSLLFLGVLSAVLAMVLGLCLAQSADDYPEARLENHEHTGIAVVVLTTLSWLFSLGAKRRLWRRLYLFSLSAASVLICITGHLGGTLTHGSNYLWSNPPWNPAPPHSAPKPLTPKAQPNTLASIKTPEAELDASKTQAVAAWHFLNDNCIACHGPNKVRGMLRLDTEELALKAGKSGYPAIIPGNASASEMIRRMQLPLEDDDHMPPSKKPQPTDKELQMLIDWINAGASWPSQSDLSASAIDSNNASATAPPRQQKTQLQAKEQDRIAQLASKQIIIKETPSGTGLIVSFEHYPQKIDATTFSKIAPLSSKIVWLDLGGSKLQEGILQKSLNYPHLKRLHLEKTNISDQDLKTLQKLSDLEYLNLYQTQISDTGLQALHSLTKLRKIYLWKTKVSKKGIQKLQQALPELKVSQ